MAKKEAPKSDKEITDEDIFGDLEEGGGDLTPSLEPIPEPGDEYLDEELLDAEFMEEEEDRRPLVLKPLSAEGDNYTFMVEKTGHGGFCDLFRQYLLRDERVLFAAYKFDYFNAPLFRVQVAPGEDIKAILAETANDLLKLVDDFEQTILAEL